VAPKKCAVLISPTLASRPIYECVLNSLVSHYALMLYCLERIIEFYSFYSKRPVSLTIRYDAMTGLLSLPSVRQISVKMEHRDAPELFFELSCICQNPPFCWLT
jgi:hypothetical protein